MISTEGGYYPLWPRNSREIFFRNEDKIMSVSVETQPTFKSGTPRMLFRGGAYLPAGNYDVAPDGQHLLLIREKEAPAISKQLAVVTHWPEELKRLAPAAKN